MTKLIYTILIVLLLLPAACSNPPADTETPIADCERILAEMKEAQAEHNADYRAKGVALIGWKKSYDQIYSDIYLDTDEPLIESVNKCKGDESTSEDFCSAVEAKYNEITPKERAAKEALTKAEEKSLESRKKYNLKLKEAADKKCIMVGNQ